MDKKKDDMPFMVGMGGLVAVAVISTKQNEIKNWLFENMMMLVLAGFAILALLVYRGIGKMKKRDEELLKRMKAVKSVQPQRNEGDYYRRRR